MLCFSVNTDSDGVEILYFPQAYQLRKLDGVQYMYTNVNFPPLIYLFSWHTRQYLFKLHVGDLKISLNVNGVHRRHK